MRGRRNICRSGLWGLLCAVWWIAAPAMAAPPAQLPLPANLPPAWQVAWAGWADLNADGMGEWALLVWRPWRDVHMAPFTSLPTPVRDNHDAAGLSCHLILIEPLGPDGSSGWSPFELERGWRELWAGSALCQPLRGAALGDLDADGVVELAALEGNYARDRDDPAEYVTVWQWNGFGFSLEWRSPRGAYNRLLLAGQSFPPGLTLAVRHLIARGWRWWPVRSAELTAPAGAERIWPDDESLERRTNDARERNLEHAGRDAAGDADESGSGGGGGA